MTSIQDPALQAWDASLAASVAAASAILADVPSDLAARRPSWGGWSIHEIFEHLCVTDGLYEAPLRSLIAQARAEVTARPTRSWRPTLWARLLLWSLNPSNTRRSTSPPAFRPGAAPRPQVIEAWIAQAAATRALMRAADGLDLNARKLSSPAARIIRLNVGDAFAINATHAVRHMGQVQRTLADVRAGAR